MPKKRFFITIIYFIFLLFSALLVNGVITQSVSYNDGSRTCSNYPPDNYDSCYYYPSCWV